MTHDDDVWFGLASDGRTYYRLQLGEEGTGRCATVSGREERMYRIRRWRLTDGGSIVIHLEHASGGELSKDPPVTNLAGKRTRTRLDLVAEGMHSVTLWREAAMLRNNERLRTRMKG